MVKSNIVLLTPKDIQQIFKIGKNKAYELMESESFPSFRINRNWYVEEEALKQWINTYTGRQFIL